MRRGHRATAPSSCWQAGFSHERDVSLRSGRRVAEALRGAGVEVSERDVDAGLLAALRADRPSCVVPMLHGETGEDGAIREILELLSIPYVGATPSASRAAFDKPVAKTVVTRAGLHTPESVCLPHETFRELGAADVMAALVERARAAADGQAGPQRLRAGLRRGRLGRPAAQRRWSTRSPTARWRCSSGS